MTSSLAGKQRNDEEEHASGNGWSIRRRVIGKYSESGCFFCFPCLSSFKFRNKSFAKRDACSKSRDCLVSPVDTLI